MPKQAWSVNSLHMRYHCTVMNTKVLGDCLPFRIPLLGPRYSGVLSSET